MNGGIVWGRYVRLKPHVPQRTSSVTKLIDPFKRTINYLRISITDRCNLRCIYCMPPEGVVSLAHDAILSYEEIARIVAVAAGEGIQKVRITGGEPLVRKGVVDLIGLLSKVIPGAGTFHWY
ncbi:MAG: molybdenum cofactor biosynthesis protein [Deltaproteobacteria bacterium]|nr:molybdenum cofactor biosynthesis protein [Deltaproteobacteria bacterium]